ncbi:hypothetical protein [Risungbinella massiliensis]|uniref:hypothetical protein n=1 Tax=Risungbinella massiliensis TaxID=1329796 RepID=UPI0005CC818E|nr:hypothetical protein [Risungbinella massiliensis]
MEERFLFGYFQTMERAEEVVKALQEKGYEASLDRVSPMMGGNPESSVAYEDRIITGKNTLTYTSMGSPRGFTQDQRVMAASHPDASGQSGGHEFVHPEDVSVTVFCSEEKLSEVQAILNSYGAL